MAQLTREDLIDALRRTTDPGWLDPLLDDPDSAAVINGLADALAFLSNAAQVAADNGTISLASGGRGGAAVLTLTRTASGTTGTIPSGYRFVDARGIVAVTVEDQPVLAGATSIQLVVVTLRKTELVNTIFDPEFTIGLDNLAVYDTGLVDALVSNPDATSAPVVATTFTTVSLSTPIEQGSSDWLSAHGAERGQRRQANEDEGAYRLRIRNVPDAVTPIAVSQAVQGAASQAGLPPFDLAEPFEDGADPTLKSANHLTSFGSLFFDVGGADPDFLDDTSGGRELRDARTDRAYFRLEPTSALNDPDASGMFCDSGFYDDPVFGFADTGLHPKLLASLMSVWEEANRKRAAGVQFDLMVSELEPVVAVGQDVGLTTVISVTPPAGKVWTYTDGVFSHDFSPAPQPATGTVAGSFHRVTFFFEDATSWSAPDWTPMYSQRLTLAQALALGMPFKRITEIQGVVSTDGTHPMNLVVAAYVVEMTA